MNKFLMLSAAALLGSIAPASAGDQSRSYTVHFFTGGGANSYCDGMTFRKDRAEGKHIAVGTHLNDGCGGRDVPVVGTVNRKKFTLNESQSSFGVVYDIYKPIENGGTWDEWVCYSGSSCFEANSGIYKLGFAARGGSRVSTTARVAQMIAARKAARHPADR
jgi:hypothetical protein